MRKIGVFVAVGFIGLASAGRSVGGELMFGCATRPACGKVCRLVCETKTLTSTCYGSECDTICIPGPSRRGCKHCCTKCCGCDGCDDGSCTATCGCQCGGAACRTMPAKCKFCWYDWFASGCAKPRTVKVLTKYQAEKEVCAYHWEVVDACECGCPGGCGDVPGAQSGKPGCRCVYKPAPEESRLGDVLPLLADERLELTEPEIQTVSGEAPAERQGGIAWMRRAITAPLAGRRATSAASNDLGAALAEATDAATARSVDR